MLDSDKVLMAGYLVFIMGSQSDITTTYSHLRFFLSNSSFFISA